MAADPTPFYAEILRIHDEQLNCHPVYAAVRNLPDLRLFMEHHVYAVWDFMSLLKYLQHYVAPTAYPWKPHGGSAGCFFINQIVLSEESDEGLPDAYGNPTYASHFELYCKAMREIGAEPAPAIHFAETAADQGIDAAFALNLAPPVACDFMAATFSFIASDKPHVVAAAFALGREHIIPEMFRALLSRMSIDEGEAPTFHYYLKRHIHLDEDFHAPLSLRMVEELIGGDADRRREAEAVSRDAVAARLKLWNGVLAAINGTSSFVVGQNKAQQITQPDAR